MRNLHSSFTFLMFIGLFFFGVQQSAEAQFRIWNNTGCTINFKVGQQNGLAANPCSLCNTSGIISLAPGAVYIHPVSAACGPEYWVAFKYFVGLPPTGSTGYHYNPGLGGACGIDSPGICNGSFINATWFSTTATGAGPTTVILN